MYEAHFGLRQRPFRPTPDRAAYYPATAHESALARLGEGLADGEGLVLVTGAPGTGKTLLGLLLAERLGPGAVTAFVPHSRLRAPAELFQAILFDLGEPFLGLSEQELRLTLTDWALHNAAAGRRLVVIVDEAHLLGPDLLEELRLLGDLEGPAGKAVQVVLLAQPVIFGALGRSELAALAQRLVVRAELAPLPAAEAADYLFHQVRCAGGRPERVFTTEALDLLAKGTGGVPRRLNQSAHLALRLAAVAGATDLDAEAALDALTALGLDPGPEPRAAGAPEPARGGEEFGPAVEAALTGVARLGAEGPPECGEGSFAGGAYVVQRPGQPPCLVYAPGRTA
jgi:type II secretory pathway predicted ATPase ExeA